MRTEKKYYGILTVVVLFLIGLLFRETFQGLVLQGVDDNVSMRQVLVRSLLSGQGYHFIPNYWLGFIFNVPNPDLYNTMLALTGNIRVAGVFMIALILSAFVTFKLIRRMDVSPLSALFSAVSYTFLPHVLSLVYSGHALALEAIPMTPAFLLCISVIADGKTDSKLFKLLAGVWGGIFWAWMMIGEPQRGIYGTVLGMAWLICLLFHTNTMQPKFRIDIKKFRNYIPFLFLILVVGLGIFLSTIKFWANSEFLANEGSWEFSTGWSFPPSELLDSLAFGYHGLSSSDPNAFYWGDKPLSGNTDSLGFFLIVFAMLGAFFAWKSQKPYLRFFAIAGLVALLLSFGKYMPGKPLYWLWYHVPGMDKLRVPAKFLSITGISWAVLAAMGLDYIKDLFSSNNEKQKQYVLVTLGTVTLLSLLWLISLIFSGGGDPSFIRPILRAKLGVQSVPPEFIANVQNGILNGIFEMTLFFILLTGTLTLVWKNPRFGKFLSSVVLVLTLYNLYHSNRYYIAGTYIDEQAFYQKNEMISFLQENLSPLYRASGSLFVPNLTKSPAPIGTVIEQGLYPQNNQDLTYAFPYHDINMFGRIPISRIDDGYYNFFKSSFDSIPVYESNADVWELNKRLWFSANVKYIIVGAQFQEFFAVELEKDAVFVTNVASSDNTTNAIYELKHALPRFAFFDNVKPVYDLYLNQELSDSLKNIADFVLPMEDSGFEIQSSSFRYTPAEVERINYNAYRIPVNNVEDKIFYFGDLYDSGWNVEVDGIQTKIYRANGIQQAVIVPAGSKEISLYYHKPVGGLTLSRVFIVLALLFALGVAVFYIVKKSIIKT